MHKRIAIGLIVLIFVLGVAIVFYHQHTDIQQLKEEVAQDKKLLEENDKPKVEHAASTSDTKPPDEPGFEWVRHGDHWDKVPIAQNDPPLQTPIVADEEVTPEVVDKPDWIYDPDREQPDGWDPKLVWEGGDVTIDFNHFRPMTEAEQAEYERLKARENPEDYGTDVNDEAALRLIAIVNVQSELAQRRRDARGTPEHDKLLAEYDRLYGRFPVSD